MTDIERLRAENAALRREVRYKDEALHRKNLLLDALHIVWCDGGCAGGVHRYGNGPITEDVVIAAERQARRLRKWWSAAQHHIAHPNPLIPGRSERIAAKIA